MIHITFHNGRAYGQVIKRQDLSKMSRKENKVDVCVNAPSILRSTHPVDTTESNVVVTIQNTIDVLKPIEMKLITK